MLRVTTAATAEPITVDDVKVILRLDDSGFDTVLPAMIAAAREIVEQQTGLALATATYEWTPTAGRTEPLPLLPATVTSDEGVYPITLQTTAALAPAALKAAMYLLVGDMLANTEASTEQALIENPALERLIAPYRRVLS
ncbi:head-tail connector protein [Castellaniella hirudinis]|uniref:head-tail connector protein n=1 Tax=Castellaniella hirudinis TaxID=1144617 RepID=UPI0039C46F98